MAAQLEVANADMSQMDQTERLWQLPRLPFLYKPLDCAHNPPGVPDSMAFDLGVDTATGRLYQADRAELDSTLRDAYVEGSMVTGMMAPEGNGREYAEDFLEGLALALPDGVEGQRVLEIGCGNGYLLERLADLGATASGVEPGPQAADRAHHAGIDITRGFFPDVGADQPVDLVILYMVLEHVPDPETLLRDVRHVLRPGGVAVIAVPDEQPYINDGEVSLLFHEHYSYFTASSLAASIQAAGGGSVDISPSSFTNVLMAVWRPDAEDAGPAAIDANTDVNRARRFPERARHAVATVGADISSAIAAGETVGVFVPARAVNLLELAGLSGHSIRFFDDSAVLHGTYYPGFDAPVESRDDLLAEPVDRLYVMSLSFGQRIAASLRLAGLSERTAVVELSHLLAAVAPC